MLIVIIFMYTEKWCCYILRARFFYHLSCSVPILPNTFGMWFQLVILIVCQRSHKYCYMHSLYNRIIYNVYTRHAWARQPAGWAGPGLEVNSVQWAGVDCAKKSTSCAKLIQGYIQGSKFLNTQVWTKAHFKWMDGCLTGSVQCYLVS